ncbi:hypothetical protein B0T10DRAFT_420369 [Thelonectria olida]|uniref:Integral membrane protein n=1 Tax=Thelonectria olida TaxID=1576542 RepID=A0A9P8VLY5_9HYPO|nr:hypothetical protein B0T10DRAFT_420369 [Thelonectria olida]
MTTPVFFEVSWSILSMICMTNVLFGFLVCGITSFTALAAIPMISSAGGALACGLCYYIYYESHPTLNRAVASVCGDIFWLVQEAGLMFYSYLILCRILRGTRRRVFFCLFWAIMLGIVTTRIAIAVFRVNFVIEDAYSSQVTINYLSICNFSLMAILECISAYFLVVVFTAAKKTSMEVALKVGVFRYLTRSTEVRVAVLAIQGLFRTLTHSFQPVGLKAENLTSQLDRFAYALFCLYPTISYIDLLASKLAISDRSYPYSPSLHSRPGISNQRQFTSSQARNGEYTVGNGQNVVEVHGGKTTAYSRSHSSQERIFEGGSSQTGASDIELEVMKPEPNVIRKTVEFQVV